MSDRRIRGLEATTADIGAYAGADPKQNKKYIYDLDKGYNVYVNRLGVVKNFVMTDSSDDTITPIRDIDITGDITTSISKYIGLGSGDSRIQFPLSGIVAVSDAKLGVGLTAPTAKFQVYNEDYSTTPLSIWDTGELGISQVLTVKNANYQTKIHVENEYNPVAPGGPIVTVDLIANTGGTYGIATLNATSVNTMTGATALQLQVEGENKLVAKSTSLGIGIGTDDPDANARIHLHDDATLTGGKNPLLLMTGDALSYSNCSVQLGLGTDGGYLSLINDFASRSIQLSTENDCLFQTLGNVSIGSGFTPSAKLHIRDDSAITALYLQTVSTNSVGVFLESNNGRWNIYNDGNLHFDDDIGLSNILSLSLTGEVGVGTATPVYKFQVQDDAAMTTIGIKSASTNTVGTVLENNNGRWNIYNDGNLHFDNDAGASNILSLSLAGDIGIGTDAPDNSIHVLRSGLASIRAQSTGDESNLMLNGWTMAVPFSSDSLDLGDGTIAVFHMQADGNNGLGTISPQGVLDIAAVGTNGGVILPRMDETDVGTPVNGMIIYDSNLNKFRGYENGSWKSLI